MISAVAVPRSGPRVRAIRASFAMLAAATLGLGVLAASCTDEEPIDRLTIVNRTPFDVEVQMSDAQKESWLILAQAVHNSSTVNEMITDMGPTWVFRFHYGGRTVGELALDREELRRARWAVEVPPEVADRMRTFGFEPPPDSERD